MPREQLLGLAGDVDRLLAAGVATAGGDSLRRRAGTLRELGKKVPALIPVAEAVERVTGADKPGPAFLDLLVMTRQVRASLAAAGVEGTLTPLPPSGPWRTAVPIRDLQPVYDALTLSGSGREECVVDAIEQKLFGDLRLMTASLRALGAGHAALADLVAEEGLPSQGAAVLGELVAGFDPGGKAADARRLRAVCRIDKKAGAELCRRALATGSVALRAEALGWLPEVATAEEAERAGLKYRYDKSRDVRVGAVRALGVGKGEEALAALLKALDDEDAAGQRSAVESLGTIRHPRATARLLAELKQTLAGLREVDPRTAGAKAKPGKKFAATMAAREKLEALASRAEGLVTALGRRKDGDLRAVARAILPLIHEDSYLLMEAANATAALGPVIDEIAPTLAGILSAKGEGPSEEAIVVLEAFPPPARAAAFPALAGYVENGGKNAEGRLRALALLADHLDTHSDVVLRAARGALTDRTLRRQVQLEELLSAVGKMGPAAVPLLPHVFDAFRSVADDVLYGLGDFHEALGRIDPEGKESVPQLIELLGHKKLGPRVIALQALAGYGPKAREAVPAVERFVAKAKYGYLEARAEQTLDAIR